MFHFIRFAAGVVTGVIAMALVRNKKTKAGLEKVEDKLREAAASTLETVEKASAKARSHLTPESTETEEADVAKPDAKKKSEYSKQSARSDEKQMKAKDTEEQSS
jgi:hypothetical protein